MPHALLGEVTVTAFLHFSGPLQNRYGPRCSRASREFLGVLGYDEKPSKHGARGSRPAKAEIETPSGRRDPLHGGSPLSWRCFGAGGYMHAARRRSARSTAAPPARDDGRHPRGRGAGRALRADRVLTSAGIRVRRLRAVPAIPWTCARQPVVMSAGAGGNRPTIRADDRAGPADLAQAGPTPTSTYPGLRATRMTYEMWYREHMGGHEPTVYAHVAETDTGQVVVQYHLFYVFNDFNNTHESDWEMVQLRFDAPTVAEALASEPAQVAFAQHGGGETASWDDDKLRREGTRARARGEGGRTPRFGNRNLHRLGGIEGTPASAATTLRTRSIASP